MRDAWDEDPAWSPDGTRIAFESHGDGASNIYTMRADGTDVRQLTANGADDVDPVRSPDGTRIAFDSNRGGRRGIYTIRADGTDVRPLTVNHERAWELAWFP